MTSLEKYSEQIFEGIKHHMDTGIEFWYARELQLVLEYKEWRNFLKVIEKSKTACHNSSNKVHDHFVDVNKMVEAGVAARDIDDIQLSRYACYLVIQNADPSKEVIALGQTYFAIKTRQQELIDNYEDLTETQKRLAIRNEMTKHNRALAEAAKNAGVSTPMEYAVFQNKGYQGLYGGLDVNGIHAKKGLKKNEKILDHMGSAELAANLFRATQTEEKLRRDSIQKKEEANDIHYAVGKKVRKTIEELGGTMPENLPTPDKGIKQIEKEQKKQNRPIQI